MCSAILCTFIFVSIALVATLNLYESRITSKNLLVRRNSFGEFSVLIVKILFQIAFETLSNSWAFIVLLLLGGILAFVSNVLNAAYYNKTILKYNFILNLILFWSVLVLFILKCLESLQFNGGFLVWIIGLPFLVSLGYGVEGFDANVFSKIKNKDTSSKEIVAQLQFVLRLVSTQEDDSEAYLDLISFTQNHIEVCPEQDCPVKSAKKNEHHFVDPSTETISLLHVLERLFLGGFKKCNSIDLRIFYAYFLIEYMHMPRKAVEELVLAQLMKPNFEQQFLIYRYKKLIEEKASQTSLKRTGKDIGVDVVGMIALESHSNMCVGFIRELSEVNQAFWMQWGSEEPKLQMVFGMGIRIQQIIKKVEENWSKLSGLSGSNSLIIKLYSKYLAHIKNDKQESKKVMAEFEEKVKSWLEVEEIDFNDLRKIGKSKAAVVSYFNKNTSGRIRATNQSFLSMFNYNAEDLLTLHIGDLLPNIYKTQERKPQQTWFKKIIDVPDYLGSENVYFVKQKNEHVILVRCHTIKLAGFHYTTSEFVFVSYFTFENSMDSSAVMLIGKDGKLLDINSACKQYFNLNISDVNQDNNIVNRLFPNVLADSDYRNQENHKQIKLSPAISFMANAYLTPMYMKLKQEVDPQFAVFPGTNKLVGFHLSVRKLEENYKDLSESRATFNKILVTKNRGKSIWDYIDPSLNLFSRTKISSHKSEILRTSKVKRTTLNGFSKGLIVTKRLLKQKFVDVLAEKYFYFEGEESNEQIDLEKPKNSVFMKNVTKFEENKENKKTILKKNIVDVIFEKKRRKFVYVVPPICGLLILLVNVSLYSVIYSHKSNFIMNFNSTMFGFIGKTTLMRNLAVTANAIYESQIDRTMNPGNLLPSEYLDVIPTLGQTLNDLDLQLKSTLQSFSQRGIQFMSGMSIDAFDPQIIQTLITSVNGSGTLNSYLVPNSTMSPLTQAFITSQKNQFNLDMVY